MIIPQVFYNILLLLSPEEQMAISCCPVDLIEVLELDEEDAPAED